MARSTADIDTQRKRELLSRLAPWGQEHLLAFWDELTSAQRGALSDEIESIDLPLVARLARTTEQLEDAAQLIERAAPPPAVRLDKDKNSHFRRQAREVGRGALRAGEVGVVLVAGGQGTRLGFDHPKGLYSIGLLSGASLLQILLEKLIAVGRRYHVRIPLFLMTSAATHAETIEYLDHTSRFGVAADDLFVFSQGSMPAVDDRTGKILLAAKGRVALSPDGHGGMLAALQSSGGFAELEGRGIRHLFYLQIDNPLVSMCGEEFLGHHILNNSEATTLAVAKHEPKDKVGNLVLVDGQLRIIEYTEFNALDPTLIGRRDSLGRLVFWAGNTAVHAFNVGFLERMAADNQQLPFHLAHKRVPYVDASGTVVNTAVNNALKFERFIFDLLPAARQAIVVECDEATEFAPVKNAPGSGRDSPESVQAQMIALHRLWLASAGAVVAPDVPVEISPLFALDEEELAGKIPAGTSINEATYFR